MEEMSQLSFLVQVQTMNGLEVSLVYTETRENAIRTGTTNVTSTSLGKGSMRPREGTRVFSKGLNHDERLSVYRRWVWYQWHAVSLCPNALEDFQR